jgi:hypothetical protein
MSKNITYGEFKKQMLDALISSLVERIGMDNVNAQLFQNTTGSGGLGYTTYVPAITTAGCSNPNANTTITWNTGATMKVETDEEKTEREEKERKERFEGLAHFFRPVKIIVSGDYVHCFFHDPSDTKNLVKISVKRFEGDPVDCEKAVAECIVKYIYGTRSQFMKRMSGLIFEQGSHEEHAKEKNAKVIKTLKKKITKV